MKKNYLLIILIIIISIYNVGCTYDNPDWKKVYLEENKYIKVPSEWIVTYKDENIFITDKNLDEDFKVYLMCTEPYYAEFADESKFKEIFPGRQYIGFKYIDSKAEHMYSNSVTTGITEFILGNETRKVACLEFLTVEDEVYSFIAFDNLITDSMAKKIALSYSYD